MTDAVQPLLSPASRGAHFFRLLRDYLAGNSLVGRALMLAVLTLLLRIPLGMVDGVITVSLAEVASAIKVLVENNRVVAEGAGAIPVAAALSGRYEQSKVCAVVSGGNLDSALLTTILQGGVP